MGINGQDTNIIKYSQGHLQHLIQTAYRGKIKLKKQQKCKSNESVSSQALTNNACKLPPIKGHRGCNCQWGSCLHMLSYAVKFPGMQCFHCSVHFCRAILRTYMAVVGETGNEAKQVCCFLFLFTSFSSLSAMAPSFLFMLKFVCTLQICVMSALVE